MNPGEPTGQFLTDNQTPTEGTESDFTFDEIGLYTTGRDASDSAGYQNINVGNRTSEDDSGLIANTAYSLVFTDINGGGTQTVSFTTPVAGGSGPSSEILYGDICEAINTGDAAWGTPSLTGATIAITDPTTSFPSITGAQTFGFLQVASTSTGATSAVVIDEAAGGTIALLAALNPPDAATVETTVAGTDAGVQNAPTASSTERERLLTHLIFSPVLKSANRTLTITYTLTVSVARTT